MRIGQQIHDLVQDGRVDELKALLADISSSNPASDSIVRAALEVEFIIGTGMTPLHKAVEAQDDKMIKLLIENGASLAAKASLYDDNTPLLLAKRLQVNPEVVAYLQEKS